MADKMLGERVLDLEGRIEGIYCLLAELGNRTKEYDKLVVARKNLLEKMRKSRLAKTRKARLVKTVAGEK